MTKLRETLVNITEQKDTDGKVIAKSITTNNKGLAMIENAFTPRRAECVRAIISRVHTEATMNIYR